MVLYYEPYAAVIPGHHHHRPPPHNSFTLGHYGGGSTNGSGGSAGTYGNPQHPHLHHQYVSEIQCPGSFSDQACPSTPTSVWHGNGSPSVYPVSAPLPASSCARSQGVFDEWPTPPPSHPTPSPCALVSGPPPPPSPSYVSSGYKVGSTPASAEFGSSQPDAGHHSPDSGLTVSSDGVSSSDSPQQHATPSSHSGGPPPPLGRPPLIRSPYEWMRKPSYQTQLNPDSMGLLDQGIMGKTRTKDKYRVVYSDLQRLELEKEFHYSRYITIRRKAELAQMLGLSERQVKIWFQNRRAKERKQVKKREELTHKDPKDGGLSLHPHPHPHPHMHPHPQHQPTDGLNTKVISLD